MSSRPKYDSLYCRVYETVIEWLRTDPQLKRFVSAERQWRTWSGQPRDIEMPSENEMPAIRLTPKGDMMMWHSTGGSGPKHEFHMQIRIETWVKGTNARDSMELWEAIQDSLFPYYDSDRSSDLAEAMAAAGVSRRELRKAAFGDEYMGNCVYGDGLLELTLYPITPVA